MEDRFTYGLNPEKLGAVSSYLCDPNTAPAEFLLVKSQYHAETGRAVSRGALFFQIRQAFLPGEVTAEEANRIGYETAMRWTKGKYQFFVCTHTDKAHIHNHIYFNATAFDRSRKFHNFIGSSFALRRLSDRVCIEHELSVIQNPCQHSKGRFLHYGQWIGEKPPSAKQRVRLAILAALEKKPTDFADFLRLMEESGFSVKQGRGGVISFLAPGQEKPTRLRASTLGAGFDPEDIKAVIAGERPLPEMPEEPTVPPRRVNLIIDIQKRMAQGKGGRERVSPIVGKNAAQIVEHIRNTPNDEKVWQHIHQSADIHGYRAEYATDIYRAHARPIEEIPYDRVNKGTGRKFQSDVYTCRKDESGKKLDKKAMLICSKALGHNRIEVVANNYIRGL